jgi:small-conductance mechanosensitive channel
MTQQQFDALVEAISAAVAKKLAEQGSLPPGQQAQAPQPSGSVSPGNSDKFRAESLLLADRIEAVIGAFPEWFRHAGTLAMRLDRRGEGGAGPDGFLLLLAAAAGLALAAEFLARIALVSAEAGILHGHVEAPGPWRLLALAAVDLVPILVLAVVARAAGGWWFAGEHPQAQLATLVLFGLVAWRSYVLVFRIWLRPGLAAARLVPVDDPDARRIYHTLSIVTLVMAAVRSWALFLQASGAAPDTMAAAALINNIVATSVYIGAAWYARDAVARWFVTMIEHQYHAGDHIRLALARRWLVLAVALFLAMGAAYAYGVLFARFDVLPAVNRMLFVIIGLILFETLVDYVTRRLVKRAPVNEAGVAEPRLADVVARCLRALARIVALLIVAEAWMVDVLALVRPDRVWTLARSGLTAGATLFVAYVAWEIVKFLAQRYEVRNPVAAPGTDPEESEDEEATPSNVSRLRTLLPVMRVAMAITIVVLTILIVLSELGVNIAPLIAGASVIGLAVSFGSQALVRDVVSGIFFLADDAFRVGEYLDVGKAKGTVEGFTLRSIRLRHQNGEVHTIPFGQLGQITNFSRDWRTVKFNLRFARDTDLEKLRKAVKKIGQEMLAEPEFKRELLQPLKMQGVTDIADNALVVRFKFTCRPMKPTWIQRQAVKRMVQSFPAQGIEFAQATISVQALGTPSDPALAAGAAAARQPVATAASS